MKLDALPVEVFKGWLKERGAEIVSPGPGEIIRFLTHEGVGCIYKGKTKDKLSFTGLGGSAYQAFIHEDPTWKAYPRPKDKRAERWLRWSILSARDGAWCVFCAEPLSFDSHTIEHFLAKTHGGTNYYANLGLACSRCNTEMGNLSVAEKIQAAIVRRLKNADRKKRSRTDVHGAPSSSNGTGLHDSRVVQAGRAEPRAVSSSDEGSVGSPSLSGGNGGTEGRGE